MSLLSLLFLAISTIILPPLSLNAGESRQKSPGTLGGRLFELLFLCFIILLFARIQQISCARFCSAVMRGLGATASTEREDPAMLPSTPTRRHLLESCHETLRGPVKRFKCFSLPFFLSPSATHRGTASFYQKSPRLGQKRALKLGPNSNHDTEYQANPKGWVGKNNSKKKSRKRHCHRGTKEGKESGADRKSTR